MKLLCKRDQSAGRVGRVKFRLWGKVELDEEENEIVKRYKFDEAILLQADQPTLLRSSALIGIAVWLVLFSLLLSPFGTAGAAVVALLGGGGAGYFYYHQKRETIYVRDLIHGRYFSCPSIIDLARDEARLGIMTSFLRQVMVSAKHWDGTETLEIEALPKDEAKIVMINGL